MLRLLLISLAFAATDARVHAPRSDRRRQPPRRAIAPAKHELVAAKAVEPKPPGFLKTAYYASGLATTAAWTKVVVSTIASNQPVGSMMPSPQHGHFARIGALSAIPLIVSSYGVLAAASKDSWAALGSESNRRLNLALVTAGVGGALWVGFAPLITRIPASVAKSGGLSHQSYTGMTRASLIGAYAAPAALAAAVWVRSLPEDVRSHPLSWAGRVADGVSKSLFSLAPANVNDPVQVKYALLSSSFLVMSAISLGAMPLAVIPSWTGRRCSRAFVAWTLLAATHSYNLKEAAESGKLRVDAACRSLSSGLAGFGAIYYAARIGAVFFDPSFPQTYGIVTQVPGYAAMAAALIGLTMRPDN